MRRTLLARLLGGASAIWLTKNKSRDDISKMLQTDFGWDATGMGMNSLDRMIAELK